MNAEQKEKFIKFFEDMFEDFEIKEINEPNRAPPNSGEIRRWTVDDYLAILEPIDNSEASIKIGRSEMSIRMQRGSFLSEFIPWMKKNGYSEPYTKEIIEEYIKERGLR